MIPHKEKRKTDTKIVKINAHDSLKTDKDSKIYCDCKRIEKSRKLVFLLKWCCYYYKIDVYLDMSCCLMISSVPGLDIHI